jgi:SAM-dependent methyltransferase
VRRQDHHLLTETTGVDNRHRWVVDAASYDTWFDQPWGAYASTVEHQLLLDAVSSLDGLRVCDAGCGTGRFAARLEAAGACVTGVDRDPAALAIASTRLTGDLVEGDVQSLPFADGQFDVTFAVTVCEFTADPAGVVAELARITRPGGHVVIGSLNPHSPWGRWTRRRFRQPPWDTARFLDRAELDAIASRNTPPPHRGNSVGDYGPAQPTTSSPTSASDSATTHSDRRFRRWSVHLLSVTAEN